MAIRMCISKSGCDSLSQVLVLVGNIELGIG